MPFHTECRGKTLKTQGEHVNAIYKNILENDITVYYTKLEKDRPVPDWLLCCGLALATFSSTIDETTSRYGISRPQI